MTTIADLGASGVYGRHLLPRLALRGHSVRALVRSPDTAHHARASGVDVRAADIFDEASLAAGLEGCDVALNLATALRDDGAGSDYARNDAVRREGVPRFLAACAKAGVPRVIQQSISMVHTAGAEWADEDTPTTPTGNPVADAANDAARDMEAAVMASPLNWLILRGGLFYGPGTGFDDAWFALARAGKLRLPGDGSGYVSLVHIADMAAATVKAVESDASRQALIVSDGAPSTWADVFGFVAASIGALPPAAGGRLGFGSWRVRNDRARAALGWAPVYGDYRAGLTH